MSEGSEPANRPRRISWKVWLFVAVVLGLNLWFDLYHPQGFFIDAVILVLLPVQWMRS